MGNTTTEVHAHLMDTIRPASAPREVTKDQLSWLRAEVTDWQAAGIIDTDQAAAITGRYRPPTSGTATTSVLGRLLPLLGGAFVGVGLIWLVAANLNELSPLTRFLTVAALWLAFLIGSEVLDARNAPRTLVGAIRLLAALGFGAVIMQAAQSLQVPAFEASLVGLWALGAMLHAHLTRSTMPFLVGLGTGLMWWFWQPMQDDSTGISMVIAAGSVTVFAASLAAISERWAPPFAWWWRLSAAVLALVALFVAAVPGIFDGSDVWSVWLLVETGVALAAAAAAVVLSTRRVGRLWLEPIGALIVAAGAGLLASWDTVSDVGAVGPDDWAHSIVSVVVYVALAVALVALGALRDHGALTWIAMVGLVVFTTFQSFAVFATIITGAWLFVVLGVIFLGTGLLFDRARRRVEQAIDVTGAGQ